MTIPEFSTRFPTTISMAALAVVLLGYISLERLGTDLLPDLHTPVISVDLRAPGKSPWEMEERYTRRLERDVQTISKVKRVYSVTRASQSVVVAEFAWDADMDFALLDVQKKTASNAGAENNDIGSGIPAAGEVVGEYCPCSDGDGDGHADLSCGGDDCNDEVGSVHPGAEETCDGYDSDCDGTVPPDELDVDADNHYACGDDCDDTDPNVYLTADEIPYDGIDQDCSGSDQTDVDGDGYDGGPNGDDCDDTHETAHPGGNEKDNCGDTLDNDCDGDIDGADDECPGSGDWSPGGNDGNWGCYCDLDDGDDPDGALVIAFLAALLVVSRRR